MKGVLLDINVLLDVFLARSEWLADSAAAVQAALDGRVSAYISAASLPTIFYLVRRNADLERARAVVKECLKSLRILPVDRETLELAAAMPASDFEDNLLAACAQLARLDAIVTRDPRGFVGSPVPALSPAEFLARLRQEGPESPDADPGAVDESRRPGG
ncbi:MAG: type II toxin-antitoxin system VapC family toxin [Isosphaeraceae bacterium]